MTGRRALGPALLVAAFALLSFWSWGKWTDVQIDIGNELYIPWQLGAGKALYRDIAYRNGPLSPYLNAVFFGALGVSLRTLVVCNLLILAGLCSLIYTVLGQLFGRFAATLCGLVFLCVFGFSQYVWVANYNYVTPYQHAQTHGFALSVAMIALLLRGLGGGKALPFAAAGACLGLVFLTKAEIFVSASAAAAVGLGLLCARRSDTWLCARRVGLFAGAALLPPAVALLALASAMPFDQAVTGTLGNWTRMGADLLVDDFYRGVTGLAAWKKNLREIVATSLALTGSAALLVAADRLTGRWGERLAPAAAAATFAGLAWHPELVAWSAVPRALPLVSLVSAVWFTGRWLRDRSQSAGRDAVLAGRAVWSVFALALLGKMLLHPRIPHYGFVLAVPATLLLVALFVRCLPHLARAVAGRGTLCRWLAVALVASSVLFWLRLSDRRYERKDFAVGTGADRIWVEAPPASLRGVRVREALARLEALAPPDSTLLVVPEGITLNYWLRRVNPTRYNLFLPTEFDAFGSDAMLQELREHPPDIVVVMHRRHGEFGVAAFGQDARFGRDLMAWIGAHYQRVERIGREPSDEAGFGILILRRRPPP